MQFSLHRVSQRALRLSSLHGHGGLGLVVGAGGEAEVGVAAGVDLDRGRGASDEWRRGSSASEDCEEDGGGDHYDGMLRETSQGDKDVRREERRWGEG